MNLPQKWAFGLLLLLAGYLLLVIYLLAYPDTAVALQWFGLPVVVSLLALGVSLASFLNSQKAREADLEMDVHERRLRILRTLQRELLLMGREEITAKRWLESPVEIARQTGAEELAKSKEMKDKIEWLITRIEALPASAEQSARIETATAEATADQLAESGKRMRESKERMSSLFDGLAEFSRDIGYDPTTEWGDVDRLPENTD